MRGAVPGTHQHTLGLGRVHHPGSAGDGLAIGSGVHVSADGQRARRTRFPV